ncbi:hypothetical protein QUF76_09710 [Desulfobacterales bacterium HSG16]|nr:hypothetical protein [Desulfobacterales bacterium HSG16]
MLLYVKVILVVFINAYAGHAGYKTDRTFAYFGVYFDAYSNVYFGELLTIDRKKNK